MKDYLKYILAIILSILVVIIFSPIITIISWMFGIMIFFGVILWILSLIGHKFNISWLK